MKTITDVLDGMKKKYGSDYKTAQLLGMTRAGISIIRKRKEVSEETAVKLAELLNEPEEKILITAAIARNSGKVKEAWERVARTLGYLVTVMAVGLSGYGILTETNIRIMHIMLNK